MSGEAAKCPLCQRFNDCALAAQRDIDSCWCQQQTFVPKAHLAMQAIDSGRCICERCAEALRQEKELGVQRVD